MRVAVGVKTRLEGGDVVGCMNDDIQRGRGEDQCSVWERESQPLAGLGRLTAWLPGWGVQLAGWRERGGGEASHEPLPGYNAGWRMTQWQITRPTGLPIITYAVVGV